MIILFALFCVIGVMGGLGWYLRVLGEKWKLWEVWLSFCALIFGAALGYQICPQRWSEFSMVLSSLFGGAAMSSFVLLRASGKKLGLKSFDKSIFPLILVVTIAQIALSTAWVALLNQLVPDLPPQTLVESFGRSTSLERASLFFLIVAWAPLTEELMVRGFLWGALEGDWKKRALISGIVFGFLHFDNLYAVFPLTIYGFMLGWLRWKSKSLWAPTLSHIGNNLVVLMSVLWA